MRNIAYNRCDIYDALAFNDSNSVIIEQHDFHERNYVCVGRWLGDCGDHSQAFLTLQCKIDPNDYGLP
jgi:hypothetical protein